MGDRPFVVEESYLEECAIGGYWYICVLYMHVCIHVCIRIHMGDRPCVDEESHLVECALGGY